MLALGMPNPTLWGALAAVLNFIPYVGSATTFVILVAVKVGAEHNNRGSALVEFLSPSKVKSFKPLSYNKRASARAVAR